MRNTLTKQLSKKSSGSVAVHRKSGRWGVKKAGNGVVRYCVHGPSGKITTAKFSPSKLIEVHRVGLPVQELHDLQASLDVPMEKLFPMLGISKATLHRRKVEGRLDQGESDRVVRFARLMGKAVEVLQAEENPRRWRRQDRWPLEFARRTGRLHQLPQGACRT